MHLAIDGYGADYQKMTDEGLVRDFLDQYPGRIGMTKITSPRVFTYRGPKPEDWGVSGFVIIAESHISVHTFPDREYINIDIFSCKEFDTQAALAEVQKVFSIPRVKVWTMERGLEYSSPEEGMVDMSLQRFRLAEAPLD